MSLISRPIFRHLRGNAPFIFTAVCVCLLVQFSGNYREDRKSTTHLLRSPYAQPRPVLQVEKSRIPTRQIPVAEERPKNASGKTTGSRKSIEDLKKNRKIVKKPTKNINPPKQKVKQPKPKLQPDITRHAKGKTKPTSSKNVVNPLSNRPDLTTSTKTRRYRYLMNVPNACASAPELVVVVCSVPTNFEKRTAVRQTWGANLGKLEFKIKMVFLTGGSFTGDNQKKLKQERDRFKDIIQKDFVDSYMNLTLKSLVMLEWVTDFCPKSKYLLKADDDMYFNLPNLVRALRRRKEKQFILGHLHDKGVPVRDRRSKWYIPREMYAKNNYPHFTVGVGYAMTTAAAKTLFSTAQTMPFFPMEDVFLTGIVGARARIPRFNHVGFYDKWRVPSCNYTKTIAEHKHEPKEMYVIHRIVTRGNC